MVSSVSNISLEGLTYILSKFNFFIVFCVRESNSFIDSTASSIKSNRIGFSFSVKYMSIIFPRTENSDFSLTIEVL